MNKGTYFKVLRKDLTSLGLLGARRIRYHRKGWTIPGEPLSTGLWDGGGLWVLWRKSDALQAKKRVARKYHIRARVFCCKIGRILNATSYRVKTDKVRFAEEISV